MCGLSSPGESKRSFAAVSEILSRFVAAVGVVAVRCFFLPRISLFSTQKPPFSTVIVVGELKLWPHESEIRNKIEPKVAKFRTHTQPL